MNRTSTLSVLFIAVSLFCFTSTFSQTNYTNSGNNANYSLNSGDSLYISGGVFTGRITSFKTGAKITVAFGATFQPEKLEDPRGTLYVYGSAIFNTDLKTNSDFVLLNYGTLWAKQVVELNGSSQTWNILYGSTLKLDQGLTNNGNTIINRGTITSGGSIVLNSGAVLTNRYQATIAGSFTANSSTVTNEALFQVTGAVTFNSGSVVSNNCRMITSGGYFINTNTVTNNGLLWAKAASGNGNITNSGTITNGANGKIKSVNLNNYGTLKGSGYFYFTGNTFNSGTTGVSGTTSDTLKIYDVSRSNSATIFDQQFGTVRPNTVYRVFAAPDTINNFPGCSSELLSNIALPVKWNYFFVNLSSNLPSLNWSADQDPGTLFEIQRSYDGTNFQAIKTIAAEENKTAYRFDDQLVNTQTAIVYYRIRAIEPNGNQKYSETRTVKFSTKNGVTIQTVPNPFTSQFTINYQSTERTLISVKVYSLNGQLQLTKNAAVTNGYNSINVPEAAGLAKGMYMVQVSNNNTIVTTEKIIKQ
jgi:hypothetical protein